LNRHESRITHSLAAPIQARP